MRYVKIAAEVLLWAVNILAALAFTFIGFGKFESSFWIRSFEKWGYSDEFRMFIGALEMACGILLAIPRTALYAAILIDVTMVGAAGTLLLNGEPPRRVVAPVVWFAIVSALGFARRRRAWRPARRLHAAANPV